MNIRNIILIAASLVVVFSIIYAFKGGDDVVKYAAEIKKEREDRDRFMRTSEESPFKNSRDEFKGLSYYEPDLKYRVIAELVPIKKKEVVTIGTNDGKEQRYQQYAYAEFDLNGYHHKMLILEIIDMGPFRGKLFFAFGDETSADETYGAGRYLDLEKIPGSQTITLDFNKAYNPYCAYNETYSCPLPPRENLLTIPIRAGEKAYH